MNESKIDIRANSFISKIAQEIGGLGPECSLNDLQQTEGFIDRKKIDLLLEKVCEIAKNSVCDQLEYIKEQAKTSVKDREVKDASLRSLSVMAIKVSEENKKMIDTLRTLRMSIDSEVSQIEKAANRLKSIDLSKELSVLNKLIEAMKTSEIQRILKTHE